MTLKTKTQKFVKNTLIASLALSGLVTFSAYSFGLDDMFSTNSAFKNDKHKSTPVSPLASPDDIQKILSDDDNAQKEGIVFVSEGEQEEDVLFVQGDEPQHTMTFIELTQKIEPDYELMSQMVSNGTDINESFETGDTLLILAAMQGRLNNLSFALTHGANVLAANKNGHTAVHWAAANYNPEVLNTILSSYSVKDVLEVKDSVGKTPLHFAVSQNSNTNVQKLISLKVDIDAKDKDGRTPLFYALSGRNFEAAKLLLAAGASFELEDNHKTSIESILISKGSVDAFVDLFPYLPTITRDKLLEVAKDSSMYVKAMREQDPKYKKYRDMEDFGTSSQEDIIG